MKTCKIILIVLYVLDILWTCIFKTAAVDDDEKFSTFIGGVVSAILYGILYSKVGIFDI